MPGDGTRILLDDVCQLVCEQPPTAVALRLVHAAAEDDVRADRVRVRVHGLRRVARLRVRVHAHVAEVVIEPRLHERPCRVGKRLAAARFHDVAHRRALLVAEQGAHSGIAGGALQREHAARIKLGRRRGCECVRSVHVLRLCGARRMRVHVALHEGFMCVHGRSQRVDELRRRWRGGPSASSPAPSDMRTADRATVRAGLAARSRRCPFGHRPLPQRPPARPLQRPGP